MFMGENKPGQAAIARGLAVIVNPARNCLYVLLVVDLCWMWEYTDLKYVQYNCMYVLYVISCCSEM
jgi:hypothetical protein